MSDGYGLLAVLAAISQPLAWISILVGAFLRGNKAHPTLSAVAEGAGWVAFISAGILDTHQQAQQAVDCSIFHTGCVDPATAASDQALGYLQATGIDLLLAVVADLIGWAAGRFWRHRQNNSRQPRSELR